MQRIESFKSTLIVVDWLVVFLLLAFAIVGIWFGAKGGPSNLLLMVTAVTGSAIGWVVKVLAFGIAYCAIATAENTVKAD